MPVNVPQNRFCTLTKSHDLKVLYKTIICFQSGTLSTNTKGVLGLLLTPCRLRFCCKAILQTSQGVWNGLVHDCSTLLILTKIHVKRNIFKQFLLSQKCLVWIFAPKMLVTHFSIFGAKIQIFFVTRFARNNNVKRDFFADFQILCFLLSSIFSLDRIPVFSPRLGPNDLPHFVWISVANHRFTCIQTIGCQ